MVWFTCAGNSSTPYIVNHSLSGYLGILDRTWFVSSTRNNSKAGVTAHSRRYHNGDSLTGIHERFSFSQTDR